MPSNKDFKRLVRGRQAETGASYSTARAQLLSRRVSTKRAVVCAVTGASGRVAYNLLFRIASGDVFGPDIAVELHLVDMDEALPALEATVMELEDCSFPMLSDIDVTSSYEAGFAGASWILMLGAPRRTANMERHDLLGATATSFTRQGRAVEQAAADVRVLVVGNPAKTNCLIPRHVAPDVPDDRWFAMLRLDHNRLRAQVAEHADVPLASVSRVAVWGNHSPTMVPDVWHALIDGAPAVELLEEAWVSSELIPSVQQRGARLIEVAGASSAGSAASAVADNVRDLFYGTAKDDWTSLGLVSHGEYGVPAGLVSGFPATAHNGRTSIVEGLPIEPDQQSLLDRSIAELLQERDVAMELAANTDHN